MTLSTVVVSGHFEDVAQVSIGGWVSFTPNAVLTDSTDARVITVTSRQYNLVNGAFTSDALLATDNANLSPSGWAYTVIVALNDQEPYSFLCYLPHSPSTVDISALEPIGSVVLSYPFLMTAGGTMTGDLTLTGSPALTIPAGAVAGGYLTSDSSGNASWAPRSWAGLMTPVAVQSGNYTASAGQYVPCSTTSGSLTITLPSAPANLSVLGAKMVAQTGTNTVTIQASGSDVFNVAGGGTTATLKLLSQGILMQYSAGIWYVLSDDLPLGQTDLRYVQQASPTLSSTLVLDGSPALQIPAGASPGYTLLSDGSGNASWGVLTTPPAAWWQLSDAVSSTTAADWSGNNWNGTATSVTFGIAGPSVFPETAASFSGTPSGVLTSFNPHGYSAFTIEAWVNLDGATPSGNPRLVANSHTDQNTDEKGFELWLSGGNKPKISLGNGSSVTTVTDPSTIANTGWQYIAATWNGSTIALYVNGTSVATGAFTGLLVQGNASGTSIGYNATYGGDYFDGYMAEVIVTSSALSPAQITARYNGALPNPVFSAPGVPLPLPVTDGGTGATSASAALTALGAFPAAGGTITGNVTMDDNLTVDGTATFGAGPQYLAGNHRIYLGPSGDTTGVTDSANIAAALTGFPRPHCILGPGTFYIDQPITAANSTWLEGSGYLVTTIEQSSTFSGSYMILSANMYGISNLSLNAPSGTITNNVAADGIYHATTGTFVGPIYLSNLNFSNLNGYALHTSNAAGGSYTTIFGDTLLNANCAGGVLMYGIGGQFINLNMTASLTGYDGCCWQECGRGGQMYNTSLGSVYPPTGTATPGGYALHFIGHNNDILIYAGNNGGGSCDCYIEDSVNGHTTGLNINDYYFQTATGPGVDIEGGSGDLMFTNCRFNGNATHGVTVNGSGSRIKFDNCLWSSAGSFNTNGVGSTVASGSNGGELSQIATWSHPSAGVLDVANGYVFSGSGGTAYVATNTTVGTITYTGVTATSLTGCAYVSGSATGAVATGGHVNGGPYYDLNWSGTATGDVVDCEFGSSIGAVASGINVQASVNIAAAQNVEFQNVRFTGSGASSANWFTNNPSAALVLTSTGWQYVSGQPALAVADLAPTGLTGATAASRYAGGTTSGAPASGTFAVGDFVVDESGAIWICKSAGSPGTWVAAGSTAPDYAPSGLTGATAASRYVGATSSGSPGSGTFVVGDHVIDQSGAIWICTGGGSPGTWTEVSGTGGTLSNPMSALGDTIYGGSSGSPSRVAGSTSATKNFYTQTGNGSVSAEPAWGTLAVGDMPGGMWLTPYLMPTGATAVTVPRIFAASHASPGTGNLYCTAIGMQAGVAVNNLTFYTNTTAAVTVSHGWYVLLDQNLVVRAVTADQTTGTAWQAQSTAYTLATTATYTTSYSGLYYVGIMVVASTMPTISSISAISTNMYQSPVICGESSTGQTTPPTTGTTMSSLGSGQGTFFMYAYTS